jgi:hypothetical protein
MVTTHHDACSKCARRNPISYRVEPEEAWKTVVLNRWRILCPSCFDAEAEKAGVRYSFTELEGQSWSERPLPRKTGFTHQGFVRNLGM